MNITFYNNQATLDVPFSFVEEVVLTVFTVCNTPLPDEVILHLVDKGTITQLHADFFNDPTPTDCISFPMDPPGSDKSCGPTILGEVFVCPEVAVEYAQQHQKNSLEETALYIIHGMLHLLGYDDVEELSIAEMRKMEAACIKSLVEKQGEQFNTK